jgi:hypothetical protein
MIVFDFPQKLKILIFFYKNVTACHGFPLEIFPLDVTGFHVTSKGKWGVANLETQLYNWSIYANIFLFKLGLVLF